MASRLYMCKSVVLSILFHGATHNQHFQKRTKNAMNIICPANVEKC